MPTYSDSEPSKYRPDRRRRYVDASESDDDYPPPRREREPRKYRPPYPPAVPDDDVPVKPSRHDESDYGRHGRDPRRRDLERKTSQENVRFRKRRDDYESDEGEKLRRSRSARESRPSRRKEYDDAPPRSYDRGDTLRPPRAGADEVSTTLPLRGKRREPQGPPGAYGATPFPTAPEPPSAAARRDKPRTYDDPYAAEPPRAPRREDPRSYSRRHPEYEEDRGYRSEGPSRRHRERLDRDDRGYDDYNDRRRRDDGYRSGGERRAPRPRPEDYYSDHREERDRRRHGRPEKDRYQDYDYDRRDRGRRDYDRPRYHDDRARSKSRKKSADWQKEAGALFTAYAMPVIKKEGTKLVKDQLQKYLQKRGSGAA